jgi:hypothetical protein
VLAITAVLLLLMAAPVWFLRDRIWPQLGAALPAMPHVEQAAPQVIDLLARVQVSRDVTPPASAERVNDGLQLACTDEQGTAIADEHGRSNLILPYVPRGDYELRIEFTRTEGDDGLDHILSYENHGFAWTLAGMQNTATSFWRVGSQGFGSSNPTYRLKDDFVANGERHVSVIKVRHGSVVPFLDGQELPAWQPEFGELGFPKPDEIPDLWQGRLGLSILHSTWVIHSIRLTEYPAH